MLFNSVSFLIFFAVVCALYSVFPHRYRAPLLLAASYLFYASWRASYLLLIIGSTLVDYLCALGMHRKSLGRRRVLLAVSLAFNLGLLGVFKYADFFASSVLTLFGRSEPSSPLLDVILPVGISFYTFQTISYTVDVYRGLREPERRLTTFALYVSFFPQLVAGPIERSTELLPQFDAEVRFDYERIVAGLRLSLWGFFKKLVIADNIAVYVDAVYGSPIDHGGPALLLATVLFAFQIFCDFSGYADIAVGIAQILGFDLMDNFDRPYQARSMTEFWRRWHISLSTWFRDYVYRPLGGNRVPLLRWSANVLIVFLLSGLWHGANWTFVVWGLYHGLFLIFERLVSNPSREAPSYFIGVFQQFRTFCLVCIGWVIFRAESITDAGYIFTHLTSGWGALLNSANWEKSAVLASSFPLAVGVAGIFVLELVHRNHATHDVRAQLSARPTWMRWAVYYALGAAILLLGNLNEAQFIYFQF
jgi:D-alanyl-lipoteichoic acid acyltransferase DltB (MBOAT superfamily)